MTARYSPGEEARERQRSGSRMAATYNNLYLDVHKRLREAGVEGTQLEARELVCCTAGKSRE